MTIFKINMGTGWIVLLAIVGLFVAMVVVSGTIPGR